MGRLLSAAKTAKVLGVHHRTVRRWIKAGRLPEVRESGMLLVDLDEAKKVASRSRVGMRDI